MSNDAEIEAVARAICKASGSDPDEICLPETPTWAAYIPEAHAAIAALNKERSEDQNLSFDDLADELADALSVYVMDKRGSLFKCLMLALEEVAN